MRAYYMLDTLLDAGGKVVNKTDIEPEPKGDYTLQGQTGINGMNSNYIQVC